MHTEIDVRSDTGDKKQRRKIVRMIIKSISEVIYYLNGGTGDDEAAVEEGLVMGNDGFEDIEGVMG